MLKILKIVFIIYGLIFSIHAFSKTLTFNCPDFIETTSFLKKPISSWSTYADQQKKQSLNHITFYYGHPKNLASLAPANNTESIQFGVSVFTFLPEDKIWLSCHYDNTQLQLIKKLPSIKHCMVKYEKLLNPPKDKIVSITCET